MRKRILTLGIIMCVVGLGFTVAAQLLTPKNKVDQAWMEAHAPKAVNGFAFNPLDLRPVDQATWDTLNPFGIVDRVYRKGDSAYEAMLVASDKRESFHSPTVCLPSQGLGIEEQHNEKITTRTRGEIPITIAKLYPPDHSAPAWIAYFYRVQDKIIARSGASIFILTLAMFQGPLLHANFDMNTVFYRFISMKPGETKADFLNFIAGFVDSAHDTSNGYF